MPHSQKLVENERLDVYFRDISACVPLSAEEEARLARQARGGDRNARNSLVMGNLFFVVKVSGEYQYYGLPLGDLIGEGNVGLIRAIQRFDERKGNRCISFAVSAVRQAMLDALRHQQHLVRFPKNRYADAVKIRRKEEEFMAQTGRAPTRNELLTKLGFRAIRLERARTACVPFFSLDEPLLVTFESEPRGDVNQYDVFIDPNADTDESLPDALLRREEQKELVELFVKCLDQREAEVIKAYFGFAQEPETLTEIGQRLNISRERARQIKEKALCKMRRVAKRLGLTWLDVA